MTPTLPTRCLRAEALRACNCPPEAFGRGAAGVMHNDRMSVACRAQVIRWLIGKGLTTGEIRKVLGVSVPAVKRERVAGRGQR